MRRSAAALLVTFFRRAVVTSGVLCALFAVSALVGSEHALAAHPENFGCETPTSTTDRIGCWVKIVRPGGDTGATGLHVALDFPANWELHDLSAPGYRCTSRAGHFDCVGSTPLGGSTQIDWTFNAIGQCGTTTTIVMHIGHSYGLVTGPHTTSIRFPACPVPPGPPKDRICVDRISVQDQYSLLKAKNDVFFHRTIHKTELSDWGSVKDNQPWGTDDIADIDLTEIPKGLANPTIPVGFLSAKDHVFIHYNLLDLGTNNWQSLDNNKPWGTTPVTDIGIAGHPSDTSLRGVAAAGSRVYFFSSVTRDNPYGSYNWADVSDNKPWGDATVTDVDVTSENRIILIAGGITYEHDTPLNLGASNWAQGNLVLATGGQFTGMERIDWDFRPAIASRGTDVFYSQWPHPSTDAPPNAWRNINDNKPWGQTLVDDITVFFWMQEEPWKTPAIVMLVAGEKPYLHWHPENLSSTDGPSDWIDTSDNAPWNGPGGACARGADLSVVKTGPATVTRGGTITYSITVTNHGPEDAVNVSVTDAFPAGFTYIPGSSDPLCTQQGNSVVCAVGNLASGASKTMTLAFTVPLTTGECVQTDVQNKATVTTSSNDPRADNNVSIVSTTIRCPDIPKGCIQIVKEVFDEDGEQIATVPAFTFRLDGGQSVQNTSDGRARFNQVPVGEHTVTEDALAGWERALVTPDGGVVDVEEGSHCAVVVFKNKKRPPSEGCIEIIKKAYDTKGVLLSTVPQFTFSLDYGVRTVKNNSTGRVTLANVPVGTHTIAEVVPAGWTLASVSPVGGVVTVTGREAQCPKVSFENRQNPLTTPKTDIEIVKSGPASIKAGAIITYTLTVKNTGPIAAQNVSVTDTPPAGFTFKSGPSDDACVLSNGIIVCQLGTMNAGEVRTLTLVFQVPVATAECRQTDVQNKATVSTSTSETNATNNQSTVSTTVICPPPPTTDISIVKYGPQSVTRGGTVTYTLTITNHGQVSANDVVVTDAFPAGFTFQAQASTAGCSLNGGTVVCQAGTLTAGQQKSFTLVFKVPLANGACYQTDVQNTGKVSTSTPETNAGNNESTVSTTVLCPPPSKTDVSVAKTGPASVTRGGTVTYTLLVTNHGGIAANDVTVIDTFPVGFVFQPGASTSGCTLQGSTVVCQVGTLTAGQQKSLILVFKTPLASGDCYQCCYQTDVQNRGNVTTSTPETNANNNESIHSMTLLCPASSSSSSKSSSKSSSSSSRSSSSSSSSSEGEGDGCIEVIKETFDIHGNVLTPVTQFRFTLETGQTVFNNSTGRVKFTNITPGVHTVSEDVPAGWSLASVAPSGGVVYVEEGPYCAVVIFKNRQNPFHSSSSSVVYSSSSSSKKSSTSSSRSSSSVYSSAYSSLYSSTQQSSAYSSSRSSVYSSTLPSSRSSSSYSWSGEYEDDIITNSSSSAEPSRFSDIDNVSLEGKAANYLAKKGVIGGYADGTFKGSKTVNRAEAAKFLLLAKFGTVRNAQNSGRFWDVKEGEWYVKYVVVAEEKGIIAGYEDGSFRPEREVNTAEFLKMLTLTFGLQQNLPYSFTDVPQEVWYGRYVGIVPRYNLLPTRNPQRLDAASAMTRGEVAIAIYQILNAL